MRIIRKGCKIIYLGVQNNKKQNKILMALHLQRVFSFTKSAYTLTIARYFKKKCVHFYNCVCSFIKVYVHLGLWKLMARHTDEQVYVLQW